MPRYAYHCNLCDATFQVTHSMSETLSVCKECDAECESGGTLTRVPSFVNFTSKNIDKKQTSKQRVDEFISTARKELAEQAAEARKDYDG